MNKYGNEQNVFKTLKASISQNYLQGAKSIKSPQKSSLNNNSVSIPWSYSTQKNNTNCSQEEMKTTDRKFDLYLQIQNKRKMEEKENESLIQRLEEGLKSDYKHYRNRKDGNGFSAEYIIQEATNKALDKVK